MSYIPEAIEIHSKIPNVIIMTLVAVFLLFLFSFLAMFRSKAVPRRLQNIFELLFGFIYNTADAIVGKEGKSFYPLFTGIFLFILISNLIGLIPGLQSPTANINTTIALAVTVFIIVQVTGIRNGILNYLKHFVGDVPLALKPLMFAIEVIGEITRPITLSLRLFGNILAKEIILGILASLTIMFFTSPGFIQKLLTSVPLIMRPLFILLGILVSFIQAFVFTLLSMIYIQSVTHMHHNK